MGLDKPQTMQVVSKRNPAGGVVIINKEDFNPERYEVYNPSNKTEDELLADFRQAILVAGYPEDVIESIVAKKFARYRLDPANVEEVLMEYETGENKGTTVSTPPAQHPKFMEAVEHVKSRGYSSEGVAEKMVAKYGVETILASKAHDEVEAAQGGGVAPAPSPAPKASAPSKGKPAVKRT